MSSRYPSALVWFRRDLRVHDNAALHHALRDCDRVYGAFVFDTPILRRLPGRDRRVEFIRASVADLSSRWPGLLVSHANAAQEIPRIARELGVQAVFVNRDYEPAAIERDARVRTSLARDGIAFRDFKDQVIFEAGELRTTAGRPYTVFTPYKKAWLAKLRDQPPAELQSQEPARFAAAATGTRVPSLGELGFEPTNIFETGVIAGEAGAHVVLGEFLQRIDGYDRTRDFPALDSTSRLGIHLRFGTVSARELARAALSRVAQDSEGAATWLSELAWRDFFFQILAEFPHVVDGCFHREYDNIEWESGEVAEERFAAWCEARTGFPMVDAAIAQINETGFMHNRLRMVAASFLVKDLGIDWRRGERWFAEKLNDYDLAANNGNWQWAASTGCDAQPWFRVFNPALQQERFDPDGAFITRWLGGRPAILPIVDHGQARAATLRRYEAVRLQAARAR
jgi:deoxyribodipyrimidine photo-lyase